MEDAIANRYLWARLPLPGAFSPCSAWRWTRLAAASRPVATGSGGLCSASQTRTCGETFQGPGSAS